MQGHKPNHSKIAVSQCLHKEPHKKHESMQAQENQLYHSIALTSKQHGLTLTLFGKIVSWYLHKVTVALVC